MIVTDAEGVFGDSVQMSSFNSTVFMSTSRNSRPQQLDAIPASLLGQDRSSTKQIYVIVSIFKFATSQEMVKEKSALKEWFRE